MLLTGPIFLTDLYKTTLGRGFVKNSRFSSEAAKQEKNPKNSKNRPSIMPSLKFLCLHGAGTREDIMESQMRTLTFTRTFSLP